MYGRYHGTDVLTRTKYVVQVRDSRLGRSVFVVALVYVPFPRLVRALVFALQTFLQVEFVSIYAH